MTDLDFIDRCEDIREKLQQHSISNSELHELLVENAKNFICYRDSNNDDDQSRNNVRECWLITSKMIQEHTNFSWPSPNKNYAIKPLKEVFYGCK